MTAKKKTAKRASSKARDGTTLKRRLAALEKRWEAGALAPHEALALCWNSDIPRHEWPAWIEPAIHLYSIKPRTALAQAQLSQPFTGPQQTRFLATIADKLVSKCNVSAPMAARAAIEAMRAHGWEHGEKVVGRVKREMTKLAKDMDGRALHYSLDWDMGALRKLAKQGKPPR
jgi:hypothetical protein